LSFDRMSDASKVRIALIGGGDIAPSHTTYLLSSPTCKLVAIIDPFRPGRDLAEKISVPHFPSIASLLSSVRPPPEAYIICTPSSLHVPVAIDLLKFAAPKAVLIEKPVATDSYPGAKLIDAAKENGTTILVGHHRRFHPSLVAAKQVIERGTLGELTAVSGLWTALKNDGYFTATKWRPSRSGGGGPVWTNLVHDVDALHFVTGSRIFRVWAVTTMPRRRHHNVPDHDYVEEGASIMMRFANGIVGTFILCDNVTSPYGWESATGENPALPKATAPVDSYRIFGTQGSLSVPDGVLWTYTKETVAKSGRERGWNVPLSPVSLDVKHGIPFREQVEHIGRVVRDKEKPRCSGDEGLAAVKVCEAVIRALELGDGTPVDIDQARL
jgi:predicted dehydrogenase